LPPQTHDGENSRDGWEAVFALDPLFVFTVLAVVSFAFLNGMHDSSGLVAAAISSRSLKPRVALTLATAAEFVGPFIFGTAVAETIGRDLVRADVITLPILFVAVSSAILWNVATWYFGLPASSTHALLGGLIGAVVMTHGVDALLLSGFAKVLLALFTAPIIGLATGYVFMELTLLLLQNATPSINNLFKRVQWFNVVALGLSHGTNDGQKSMGLIALALTAVNHQSNFAVPLWVTLLCALSLSLGVNSGGWRIIKTIGGKIYRLRPVHAFAAQTSSAIIVLIAALLGGPVSTTQVVSTSIVGVGMAERISAVRWQVTGQIVTAWIITIPATVLVAVAIHYGMMGWIPGA
jgi:inorganic phosphate transporter, PiT family